MPPRSRHHRVGIEAPEPAIARATSGSRGCRAAACASVTNHRVGVCSPSTARRAGFDRERDSHRRWRDTVETFLEAEPPIEDLLHDAPALDAEVEGGPNPLGRERQTLPAASPTAKSRPTVGRKSRFGK